MSYRADKPVIDTHTLRHRPTDAADDNTRRPKLASGKKTIYMIFARKKKRLADVKIEIDNEIISKKESSNFLGVHIDNKLNWKMHIGYVSGKIARGIGILIKARKVLSNEWMTNLYNAFI